MTDPSIHRLLDEAFAGVAPSPDAQDLKEEVRANLIARAAELEAAGTLPPEAASRAIAELGDIRGLVGDLPATPDWQLNRVRPKPGFVVRVTVVSIIAAAALVTVVLAGTALIPDWLSTKAAVLLPLGLAWVVFDSLRQETGMHYPMTRRRALGFGVATVLVLAALVLAWLTVRIGDLNWIALAVSSGPFLAGIGLFAYLGATQTNRLKPWAFRNEQGYGVADNFTKDPAAAARFGIYTVVMWTASIAAFLVLGFAWSWAWSWVALVAGVLLWFLVLARMLFGPAPTR